MASSKTYYKRRIGTDTYETLKVSKYNADLFYGSENDCYVFNYWNGSVADSGRLLEQCNQSSANNQHGYAPLFTMSGIIEFLPQGFAFGKSGKVIITKGVYRVLFSRLGTAGNLFNDFDATLSDTCGKDFGYKTIKEAIHAARCAMVNHFAAVRGVYNADFLLKPFVKPVPTELVMDWQMDCDALAIHNASKTVPTELVAAVAQVDAALATTPVDLEKFKAAAQRLQMDCDALTAIHNASKPCGTTIAILSKESMSGDANAVLPNATWEDLKKLEFVHYQDCCDKLRQDAAKEIEDVKKRLQVRLNQEQEHHWRVVDQVCDCSKTVEDRLTYLQNLYGRNATIVGKRLDVYT